MALNIFFNKLSQVLDEKSGLEIFMLLMIFYFK